MTERQNAEGGMNDEEDNEEKYSKLRKKLRYRLTNGK